LPEPELPVLVARSQKGDRAAFEKLVQRTARVVYAQIVAAVRDRQKAEDLTQETFTAAWKAIATVQQPAGFVSWLLTLARNTTLDAIKCEGRQKRGGRSERTNGAGRKPAAMGEGAAEVADRGPSPSESLELAEAREHALKVLEELPEEYRRPLSMRYLAGADYHAIREALDLSDGALRGLLNRGMALLRERMTKLQGDKVKR